MWDIPHLLYRRTFWNSVTNKSRKHNNALSSEIFTAASKNLRVKIHKATIVSSLSIAKISAHIPESLLYCLFIRLSLCPNRRAPKGIFNYKQKGNYHLHSWCDDLLNRQPKWSKRSSGKPRSFPKSLLPGQVPHILNWTKSNPRHPVVFPKLVSEKGNK